MYFLAVFILAWLIFWTLADRKRIVELYPVALLGMVMSLTSDVLTGSIPLWSYHDAHWHLHPLLISFLDDLGIYPVISFLYAQFLPHKPGKWLLYTFCWIAGGIMLEFLMVREHIMKHHLFWSLIHSYGCDWIIFTVLTLHCLLLEKQRRRNKLIIRDGRASLTLTEPLNPLPPEHPLAPLDKNGMTLYQGARTDALESFVCILEPNAVTPVTAHRGYELHYLLNGRVVLQTNEQNTELHRGELYHFPSETPHSFINPTSAEATLISFWLQKERATTAAEPPPAASPSTGAPG